MSPHAALEALTTPQGIGFNVLVSDIGLAGVDGYELIHRVRGDLSIPPQRTAFGRKEDRQHALDAGFQAHVSKPTKSVSWSPSYAGYQSTKE